MIRSSVKLTIFLLIAMAPATVVAQDAGTVNGPVLDISPASFAFEIPADGSDSAVLDIGNLGDETLIWNIDTAEPTGGVTTLLEASEAEAPPITSQFGSGTGDQRGIRDTGSLQSLGEGQMSQTSDTNIVPGNSIVCALGGPHHLLRRFYFEEHPEVGNPTGITSVDIAIQEGEEPQTLTVNLYTLPSDVPVDSIPINQLAVIGSADVAISPSDDGTMVNVPVSGTVSDTEAFDLVVEATANVFYIGATDTGETHPGFIVAPECSVNRPTPIDEIDRQFDDTHIIMVVNTGESPHACDSPSTISWLSVSPEEGKTEPESSEEVGVKVDASAVEPGNDYTATLCVTTNDPNASLVEVPVTMVVEGVDTEARPSETAAVLGTPSPNPVRGSATPTAWLTLNVDKAQEVVVEVFDATGRRIDTLLEGALAAGRLETLRLDTTALPAGAYVIRAVGENFTETRNITVVK